MKTFLKIAFFMFLIYISTPIISAHAVEEPSVEENIQEDTIFNNNFRFTPANSKNDIFLNKTNYWALYPNNKKSNTEDEDTLDPNEQEFELFNTIWEEDKQTEETLIGKILHSGITRTDIPSFLLKDDLTFEYKKGPISKAQFFGAYKGNLNAIFNPHNYSTTYDGIAFETGLYGQFKDPDYNFKLMFRTVPTKGVSYGDQFIGDAFIVSKKIPHHQVSVGYSRVQTGIEGGAAAYVLPFINRSQIARNFGNTRSLNLKVSGNYNYADYSISYGSSGRYITNGMPGTEFNAQVSIKPFGSQDGKYGKLTIGGGLNTGHNVYTYTVGSLHVAYKHKRLWTLFEAAIADGYNGSGGSSPNKACGYAFTAGWKFTPHWQLIGRIDQFDPNRNVSHNIKREYSVGINWFIKGQALKIVLNWVFCENQNGPNSHRIMLGTQILI